MYGKTEVITVSPYVHYPQHYTPFLPEDICTSTQWGLCGHMFLRSMLAVGYATGRAPMPDRSRVMTQKKRDTLILQAWGWAWGYLPHPIKNCYKILKKKKQRRPRPTEGCGADYCLLLFLLLMLLLLLCLLSQTLSSRYFSWTSVDPHRSGFKLHTAVLSILCVMFQVQLSFVVNLLSVFLVQLPDFSLSFSLLSQ